MIIGSVGCFRGHSSEVSCWPNSVLRPTVRSSPPANAPLRLPPSSTHLSWIFLLVTHARVAGPEVHHGLLMLRVSWGNPGMIEIECLIVCCQDWCEVGSEYEAGRCAGPLPPGQARRKYSGSSALPDPMSELSRREISRPRPCLGSDEWLVACAGGRVAGDRGRSSPTPWHCYTLATRLDAGRRALRPPWLHTGNYPSPIRAWGVFWTRSRGPRNFRLARSGAQRRVPSADPVQFVRDISSPFRRRLEALDQASDHAVLHSCAPAV